MIINWKNIDDSWKEFAKEKNEILEYQERNLFSAIKCSYQIKTIHGDLEVIYKGVLWKTTSGHNRDYAIVNAKFNNKINVNKISNSFLKNTLFNRKLNPTEKEILRLLKNINGQNIELNKNILTLRLYRIIDSSSTFNKIPDILDYLKNENL